MTIRDLAARLSKPAAWFTLTTTVVFLIIGARLNGVVMNAAVFVAVVSASVTFSLLPWVIRQPIFLRILWACAIACVSGLVGYYSAWVPKRDIGVNVFLPGASHPPGEVVDGIPWSDKFTEVRVTIFNSSKVPYQDIDLVISTRGAVADASVVPGFDACTLALISPVDPQFQTVNAVTGERTAIPRRMLATEHGVRFRCASLPSNERAVIVLAAVRFPSPENGGGGPDVSSPTYWVAIKDADGRRVWSGHPNYSTEVFGTAPNVSRVIVDGKFVAEGRSMDVAYSIPPQGTVVR